jgi:hypothetical protein
MPEVNRSAFAAAARGGGGSHKSPLLLAADPVPVVSAGPSRAPDPIADGGSARSDLSPAQQRQVEAPAPYTQAAITAAIRFYAATLDEIIADDTELR